MTAAQDTQTALDWLPDIPSGWDTQTLGTAGRLRRRAVREQDRIVTAFRDGQVTLRANRRTDGFTEADKEIGYQGIRRGDLVIHSMDAFAGAIGVSDSDGKSTPVYSAIEVNPRHNAHYLAYLLRNLALTGYIEALAKGIRERSTDFRWSNARSVAIPVPPKSEQDAIVDHLDRETAEIDEFIADQEKLIELLTERRAASIMRAVTRGYQTSELVDSSVDWLGEVPAAWKLSKVRSFATEIRRRNEHLESTNYLSLMANRGIILYAEKGDVGNKAPEDLTRCKLVNEGDFVLNSMNFGIGSFGISPYDGVCSPVYIVLRIIEDQILKDFLELVFSSRSFQKHAQELGNGILEHRRSISWDTIKNLTLALPPRLEMPNILERVNADLAEIDATIVDARRSIALSKERRAALISAAVTGKIDVREHGKVNV